MAGSYPPFIFIDLSDIPPFPGRHIPNASNLFHPMFGIKKPFFGFIKT
jgi:hypothetical protein